MTEQQSLTKDLTYTVTGSFTSTEIILEANIPNNLSYDFYSYEDLSIGTAPDKLNSVLIYMRRSDGDPTALQYTTPPPFTLHRINDTHLDGRKHDNSTGFDWLDTRRCVIVLLHDEARNQNDVDTFMRVTELMHEIYLLTGVFSLNIGELFYESFTKSGTEQSQQIKDLIKELYDILSRPRRAGMSVIVKA